MIQTIYSMHMNRVSYYHRSDLVLNADIPHYTHHKSVIITWYGVMICALSLPSTKGHETFPCNFQRLEGL